MALMRAVRPRVARNVVNYIMNQQRWAPHSVPLLAADFGAVQHIASHGKRLSFSHELKAPFEGMVVHQKKKNMLINCGLGELVHTHKQTHHMVDQGGLLVAFRAIIL